ncbi:MAG: type VII toxin-antitoxin system MntA family adenylyltransferase antitoxin [Kiritimatiellia bacterium]
MNTTVSQHRPTDALSLDAAEMARRFRQHKDIRLVFLFGSRVTGRSRKDSDIDIAFWLDPWPGASDFNLIGRLVNACAGIFPSHLIDVVILNEASSVLRLRVVQTGRLLYERVPGDRKRFAMQTAKDSQDGEYRRKLAYNWRLERIKKGGQHGRSGDILAAARSVARLFGQTGTVQKPDA